jgi:hypothetical protein
LLNIPTKYIHSLRQDSHQPSQQNQASDRLFINTIININLTANWYLCKIKREKAMKSSDCSTTTLLLSCSLVLVVVLHVASGFHNNPHTHMHPHTHRTNRDIVGKSLPLLTNSPSRTSSGPFTSNTVLFNLLFGGIEEDPLETDRRQSNRRLIERTTSPYTRNVDEDKSGPAGKTQKRYVRPISEENKDSSSSRKSETKQPEQQPNKPRLVRASTSQSSSSTLSSELNKANPSTNSNERKAKTTESAPGINIQLQDPKERVLVRHATASSAYSVDDFKGKKKKIIKPWRSGRKKNIRKQSNTGGLGRDGYGEELEVEVKNRPKKKRLVVAGSQGSNSKDSSSAAVNLLGGGKKVLESESDEDEDERSSDTVVNEDVSDSASIAKQQENSIDDDDDEKRTVRYEQPQPPQDPTIESSSSTNNGNKNDGNERKAATSTTAGVNLELKDPKERVLVRHATASSAYSVDDFKDKKKKIIKPWSSGRKKNIRKQSNTGGLGRDGYGEDLEVEVKNRPEKKRLVMARTSSSGGTQDAAKALISGGAKENTGGIPPPTSADAKEEWINETNDDDDQTLVRPGSPGKTTVGTMDEGEREPTLIRHTPTKFKGTGGDGDEPSLVRHVPIEHTNSEDEEEPSLVRHMADREDVLEDDKREGGEEEQRLVRAISASPSESSSHGQPKLVRANVMEAIVEKPKLVRPNFVNNKVEEPKLVRANVVREIVEEPKLVRANVQKEKPPERNLVRPKIEKEKIESPKNLVKPDRMGQKQDTSTRRRLVQSPSSKTSMDDIPVADLMYGAKSAIVSPTAVPLEVKPKNLVKPAFATGSTDSTTIGSSKIAETKTTKPSDIPDDLMYGAKSATASPTAVRVDSIPKKLVRMPVATQVVDDLMYGAKQATVSPTAVSPEVKPKNRTMIPPSSTSATDNNQDNFMYGSAGSSDSSSIGLSPTSVPIKTKPKKFVKFESNANTMMDNLMYGSKRATASPTSVTYEPKLKKFVNPSTETAAKTSSSTEREKSSELYPDGDGRKESETRRLVRASPSMMNVKVASKESRYVKPIMESDVKTKKKYVEPTTSAMDNAPDYDICQPVIATSNPAVVNVDMPVSKKEIKRNDGELEKKKDSKTKKTYVQPTASAMDNVPDWDICQPAIATSNPAVVNVDMPVPVSRKEIKRNDGELEKKKDLDEDNLKDTKTKKTYVQSTASVMDNVPDWDLCQPAITTSNPAVVNVDMPVPVSRKEIKSNDGELKKKKDSDEDNVKDTKIYVQPTASAMDNVPDWDICQPAITTSNPAVVNVDMPVPVSRKEIKRNDGELEKKKDLDEGNVKDTNTKKTYVQSTASVMDNVPDWDSTDSTVQPAIATSNPSVFNVGVSKREEEKRLVRAPSFVTKTAKDDAKGPSTIASGSISKERKEEGSMFAMTPAAAETMRQQVKSNRKVAFARSASADTPFEYKQLQSIPKETNPANAKPIRDEETKTKLPAAIAHAAGSSKSLSNGWTPTAHFPSDGDSKVSTENQDSDTKNNDILKGKTQAGAMKSPDDPDALPRPTGVIPLTISSSAKEKSQLFRVEHALEPVNDDDDDDDDDDDEQLNKIDAISEKDDDIVGSGGTPDSPALRKTGSSTNSMLGPDQQPLPNPSGVISFPDVRPMTTTAPADPARSKIGQHSRPNHPIEDNDITQKKSLSSESSSTESKEQDDTSNSNRKKKLYLYDGGNPQPKEPWDFSVKGLDTKLDENLLQQQESSTTKKKLVAYDGSQSTGGTDGDVYEKSLHLSSDVLPLGKDIGSGGKDEQLKTKKKQSNDGRRRFKEKTVSPFTRTVSDNNDENENEKEGNNNNSNSNNNGRYNDDDDSIDTVSKDVSSD